MSEQWKLDFPDWEAKIRAAIPEIELFIAANIQFNRGQLFDNEGAYNGHSKWQELSFRNGQILKMRGTLSKSMGPVKDPQGGAVRSPNGILNIERDSITIGTTLAYAAMMNNGTAGLPGGVLRPTKAKALKIPLPSGQKAGSGAQSIHRAALQRRIDKMEAILFKKKDSAKAEKYVQKIEDLRERMTKKGKGAGNFMFLKSVRIPARRFDEWNLKDQAELDGAIMAKLAQVISR